MAAFEGQGSAAKTEDLTLNDDKLGRRLTLTPLPPFYSKHLPCP